MSVKDVTDLLDMISYNLIWHYSNVITPRPSLRSHKDAFSTPTVICVGNIDPIGVAGVVLSVVGLIVEQALLVVANKSECRALTTYVEALEPIVVKVGEAWEQFDPPHKKMLEKALVAMREILQKGHDLLKENSAKGGVMKKLKAFAFAQNVADKIATITARLERYVNILSLGLQAIKIQTLVPVPVNPASTANSKPTQNNLSHSTPVLNPNPNRNADVTHHQRVSSSPIPAPSNPFNVGSGDQRSPILSYQQGPYPHQPAYSQPTSPNTDPNNNEGRIPSYIPPSYGLNYQVPHGSMEQECMPFQSRRDSINSFESLVNSVLLQESPVVKSLLARELPDDRVLQKNDDGFADAMEDLRSAQLYERMIHLIDLRFPPHRARTLFFSSHATLLHCIRLVKCFHVAGAVHKNIPASMLFFRACAWAGSGQLSQAAHFRTQALAALTEAAKLNFYPVYEVDDAKEFAWISSDRIFLEAKKFVELYENGLSPDEYEKFVAQFNLFDIDLSGDLDKGEFKNFAVKYVTGLTDVVLDQVLNEYLVYGKLDLYAFLNVLAQVKIKGGHLREFAFDPRKTTVMQRNLYSTAYFELFYESMMYLIMSYIVSSSVRKPSSNAPQQKPQPQSNKDGKPPQTVDISTIHRHPMTLAQSNFDGKFVCNWCNKSGLGLHYTCSECNFDCHLSHGGENEEKSTPHTSSSANNTPAIPPKASPSPIPKAYSNSPVVVSKSSSKKGTECKHWKNGYCKNGKSCEYYHDMSLVSINICSFFVNGYCKNGDTCKLKHEMPPTLSSSDNANVTASPSTEPLRNSSSKTKCIYFPQGKCRDGNNCKFSHAQ